MSTARVNTEPLKEGRVMHTRTKRKQNRPRKPLLYTLPEDTPLVKEVAFVEGIANCYQAHVRGKLPDVPAVQDEARVRCNKYQSAHSGGRTGTNDPRGFKEIFLPTYTHAHAAMIRLLRLPDAADALRALDDTALVAYLHHYTAEHSDLVEAAYVGYAFDLAPMA
jgi:hypothetical protein